MQKTQKEINRQSMKSLSFGKRLSISATSVIGNVVLMIYSLTCIFPIIWMIYSSMKEKSEFTVNPVGLPEKINIKHYVTVLLETDMFHWLWNTFRNTILSLILVLLIGFILGYFIGRFNFKGRKALYTLFMLGVLIPIHALMIPIYIQFHKLNLDDKWYTLLIPYVSFGLPTTIFLVESSIHNIPTDIEEAAAIDGSSFSRTLFRIMLPISSPVLVTAGIMQFFGNWNEFSFSLLLISDSSLKTVPVGLTLCQGQYTTDYPRMMATMIIAILPAMIVYFCFSGQIIKGMVAGAVKG